MTQLTTYRLYIDGDWVDAAGDEALTVVNPATEEVIGEVPQASVADVDRAVDAARPAVDEGPWPWASPKERSAGRVRFVLGIRARTPELVELIIAEAGAARPIAENFQFEIGMKYAEWFAERAATFPFVDSLPVQSGPRGLGQGVILKEPIGVVAAITAFNYPLYLNLAKVAPALAMGNSVVLKPSPYTPREAFVLGEIADEAGLPTGVRNVGTTW